MRLIKKDIAVIMFVLSLIGVSAYSTSSLAQGGSDASYGRITIAIDNVIDLLTTARQSIGKGVDTKTLIKIMKATRQESKEITGDNFGAELDFAQDDLKRAYKAIKNDKPKTEQIINLNAAISAFHVLKKLAR